MDEVELVVIVGAARSGTTLLRLLFDGHAAIAAPAEAGLPVAIQHLARVWSTIDGHPGLAPQPSELSELARCSIRSAMLAPMAYVCDQDGSTLYCDKSLDSVHHLALVDAVFPRTKYVLVFRHIMDMIASGLEASPWGFNGFGFGPFVQSSPGNLVAALGNYWLAHVDKALKWEAAQPERCHRILYEDLVRDPAESVAAAFEFLGVPVDLGVLELAGGRRRHDAARGPGDYKAAYNSNVHTNSVGRGKRVPVAMLSEPLVEAVNEKLRLLGYAAIDQSWNITPREAIAEQAMRGDSGAGLQRLMSATDRPRSVPDGHDAVAVAVVPDDLPAARWIVDLGTGAVRPETGETAVDVVVSGAAADLESALTGETNLGQALHSGSIRYVTADEDWAFARVAEVLSDLRRVVGGTAAA